jgi:hypothetical protein
MLPKLPLLHPQRKPLEGGLFWLVGGGVVFVCLFFWHNINRVYSPSIDLANHYALINTIADRWTAIDPSDPSLREMAFYPRASHVLAALVGRLLGSSFLGMQVTGLAAVVCCWFGVLAPFFSLGWRRLSAFTGVFLLLLIVNRFTFKFELIGHELLGNYFYSQIVAQAIAMVALTLAFLVELRGARVIVARVALAFAALFVENFHLLPALVLIGVLAVQIFADILSSPKGQMRGWLAATGILLLALTVVFAIKSPAFQAMRHISENDGQLLPTSLTTIPRMVVASLFLGILSLGLLVDSIWLSTARKVRVNLLLQRHFGAIGAVIAGLCLVQCVALNFHEGSAYACKKYAFLLATLLILNLATFFSLNMRLPMRSEGVGRGPLRAFLIIFGCAGIWHGSFVDGTQTDKASSIVSYERSLNAIKLSVLDEPAGKFAYVLRLDGVSRMVGHLFTIGIFRTPVMPDALNLLLEKPAEYPEQVGKIFTSGGSQPWDVQACRQRTFSNNIVMLDGGCVLDAMVKNACIGTYRLDYAGYVPPGMAEGFAYADSYGRWTVGPSASFSCFNRPVGSAINRIKITAVAFTPGSRTQKVDVSLNGRFVESVLFEGNGQVASAQRDFSVPVPNEYIGSLRLDFSLVGALSPLDTGLSTDGRKLGISIREITYE